MAHRSWCSEIVGETVESNERLEFLGDAVLGWVVADLVYRRYSDLAEGKLTDLRKSVVNATALAAVAESLDIGDHLLLGKGEDAAGGRYKPSILSDAFEAVIGAIYLDGGPESAHRFVAATIGVLLADVVGRLDRLDNKTVLQELVAHLHGTAPVYLVRDEGPDHEKTFHATVLVNGERIAHGTGRSKKAAEQQAAALAYEHLAARSDDPV
jgi:ribonuclease III